MNKCSYHRLSSIIQHPVSAGVISTFQAFDFSIEIFNKALAVTHFVSEFFQLSALPTSILDLLQLLESISGQRHKLYGQEHENKKDTDQEMGKRISRQSAEKVIDLSFELSKLFANRR